MARATSSFPVPLAPSMSTLLSLAATMGRTSKSRFIAALRPMMSWKEYVDSSFRRSSSTCRRSWKVSTPPMIRPSSLRRGVAEIRMGIWLPSTSMMYATGPVAGPSISRALRSAHALSQMFARKTSRQGRPTASSRRIPVISSAARLKDMIRQSRSTVKTPSPRESRITSRCASVE